MNNNKKLLRSELRTAYKAISNEVRTQIDKRLIEQLLKSDLYNQARNIFVFASAEKEINTHDLIETAYCEGKMVALPKCLGSGIMEFYEYTGELTAGKFGILEPTSNRILFPNSDDLMIVPGLAFDRSGYRIGQGGGYYDRYLIKHSCITVGLCREMFLLKDVPVMWNDIPVDFVITENAVYDCKNNGASEEAPSF